MFDLNSNSSPAPGNNSRPDFCITPHSSILEVQDATVIKNDRILLDHLTMTIPQGRHTVIFGPNGSGKSSLLKLITSEHIPVLHADGSPPVLIYGRDDWNVFELRSLLGVISTDLDRTFVERARGSSVEEVVLSGFFSSVGLTVRHQINEEMQKQAKEALHLMEASHLAHRRIERLSTGEARRVIIARALAPTPKALLLDEPTTGLDIVAAHRFMRNVRKLIPLGKTIILVTHHLSEVMPEIKHAVLLKKGAVFAEGPVEEMLTTPLLSELFGAPMQIRHRVGGWRAEME